MAIQLEAEKKRRIQGKGRQETTIMISRKSEEKVLSAEKIGSLFPMGIYNSDKSIVLLAEEKKERPGMGRDESAILIAAKNGITEIIEGILKKFPVAIHDTNSQKKNMVHLAVEHRQPQVFDLLHKRELHRETIFRGLDDEGNSALHLAAGLRDYRPWNIPGAALQMQWEQKWYEYVEQSMPLHFYVRCNKEGKTAKEIFDESHKDLIQNGREWLKDTSESCSVVAALIATVAFATSATMPGGVDSNTGKPTLEHQPAFNARLLGDVGRHVPRHPHVAPPGEGLQAESATEADRGTQCALSVHRSHPCFLLCWPFLRAEGRAQVRRRDTCVRSDVPPSDLLRGRTVPALL